MASTDAPRAFDVRAGMGINPDMLKMSMKVVNGVEMNILRRVA